MKKSHVVKDVILSAYCLALLAASFEDTNKEQSKKLLLGCLKFASTANNQILIDMANRELGNSVASNKEDLEIKEARLILGQLD